LTKTDGTGGAPTTTTNDDGSTFSLVTKDSIPGATLAELKRLRPKRIIVLGGMGVVSVEVETALAPLTAGRVSCRPRWRQPRRRTQPGGVSRLAGADRYRTAAAISKDGFGPGAPIAYIATGLDFPDALAGGATAALKDGPVLLVSATSIPKATHDELTRLKPKRVVVLGGTARRCRIHQRRPQHLRPLTIRGRPGRAGPGSAVGGAPLPVRVGGSADLGLDLVRFCGILCFSMSPGGLS